MLDAFLARARSRPFALVTIALGAGLYAINCVDHELAKALTNPTGIVAVLLIFLRR